MRKNFKKHYHHRKDRLPVVEKSVFVFGVWQSGQFLPADKKIKRSFYVKHVPPSVKLKDGDMIEIKLPSFVSSDAAGEFQRKIGNINDPYAPTELAMAEVHLPNSFSDEAEKIAQKAMVPLLESPRKDLTNVPFCTIDGVDARDFDDAVWGGKTTKGYRVIVAIADVSWYVLPGSELDKEAYQRGNSTYFPDRVVPMLPFSLSNGMCSLNPNESRGALVCDLELNKTGEKIKHTFYRALIRSQARLTYDEVQKFMDESTGIPPVVQDSIKSLISVYHLLLQKRQNRGVLELDVPERKVELNSNGQVLSVQERVQIASMQLIEELMILANVSAAETLEKLNAPTMYRVHDKPSDDKMERFNDFLKSLGQKSLGVNISSQDFNTILKKVDGKKMDYAMNKFVLRTQSQAEYSPNNIGHYGLALERYVHFTSPIRRYSDLLVHRSLVGALKLGKGSLNQFQIENFDQLAEHISYTERQSAMAEQNAVDRYMARYMHDKIGGLFYGRISSVTNFGVFLTMNETGADGFVPFRSIHGDYYKFDEKGARLVGVHTKKIYKMGDEIPVILRECDPVTGMMMFSFAKSKDLKK